MFFKIHVHITADIPKAYRVTDEVWIVETVVWPSFFLMNVFFALKGSKLFSVNIYSTEWSEVRQLGIIEHQSGRSWSVDENAYNSWTAWYILIKFSLHCLATIMQKGDETSASISPTCRGQ